MQADAVAYPYAVMVHANNTSLALGAVMRSWRFDRSAIGAPLLELFPDKTHFADIKSAHLRYLDELFTLRLREGYHTFSGWGHERDRATIIFTTFLEDLVVAQHHLLLYPAVLSCVCQTINGTFFVIGWLLLEHV